MSNSPQTQHPGTATVKKLLMPPDERFWKRYSPHHEAPLSWVTSFVMHGIAIALAILVARFIKDNLEDRSPPTVRVASLDRSSANEPGGGGNPGGAAGAPGLPDERGPDEAPGGASPTEPLVRKDLTPAQVKQEIQDIIGSKDPRARAMVKNPSEMLKNWPKLNPKVRDAIRRAGRGPGGNGPGNGPGTGLGNGPGTGPGGITETEQRMLRWSMTFNTLNGQDYANQLAGLHGILATPVPNNPGKFRVYRDLTKRPVRGKVEDLSNINRIYWIDTKPQSIRALATALHWSHSPELVVAFFPRNLEMRLLSKEAAFIQQKYNRKVNESDIELTRFEVIRNGRDYDFTVRSVTLRK